MSCTFVLHITVTHDLTNHRVKLPYEICHLLLLTVLQGLVAEVEGGKHKAGLSQLSSSQPSSALTERGPIRVGETVFKDAVSQWQTKVPAKDFLLPFSEPAALLWRQTQTLF